ncbi:MAG: hypothetical protein HUJ26_00110, partial [Planctomycetaceae bacterium]|nr:hypothetical protein [Planctomycetaceae bacterium]
MSNLILPNSKFGLQDVDWEQPVSPESNLAQGLAGLWLSGGVGYGSSKLYDISGRHNHGTLANGSTWSGQSHPGGFGSLEFDGFNDYVRFHGTSGIINGELAVSLSCWVYLVPTGTNQNIIGIRDDGDCDFHFAWLTSSTLEARCRTSSGFKDLNPSYSAYENTWAMVSFVRDGANLDCYINDVNVASRSDVSGSFGDSEDFRIGIRKPSSVTDVFKGNIANPSLHLRALSPTEVCQLYTESLQGYPTLLNRQRRFYPAVVVGGGGAVTITPNDVATTVAVDQPTITQTHQITPTGPFTGVFVDQPAISQTHEIAPNDVFTAVAVDQPTVDEAATITPNDVFSGVFVDEPTITQTHEITPNESTCAVSTDQPTITQQHEVTPNESSCSVSSDEPAITQTHVVTPDESACGVTTDEPGITQVHEITPNESACSVTTDEPSVAEGVTITPDESACAVTADEPSISQVHEITPNESSFSVTVDSPILSQLHQILADESVCAVTVDEPVVTAAGAQATPEVIVSPDFRSRRRV